MHARLCVSQSEIALVVGNVYDSARQAQLDAALTILQPVLNDILDDATIVTLGRELEFKSAAWVLPFIRVHVSSSLVDTLFVLRSRVFVCVRLCSFCSFRRCILSLWSCVFMVIYFHVWSWVFMRVHVSLCVFVCVFQCVCTARFWG